MINANTPWANPDREGTSRMVTGFKFEAEHTFDGLVAGQTYMFLRWATAEYNVPDRTGNWTGRDAWIKNVATGKVSKRRFGMHCSVKIA